MTNAEGLASLALRAKWARGSLLAFAVIVLLSAPLPYFRTYLVQALTAQSRPLLIAMGVIGLAEWAILLGNAVAIPMWVYRARANLSVTGVTGLRYSPTWSAVSFFVPLLGLFVPFLAMRQIYNRSLGEDEYQVDTSAPDVTSWWACYVSGVLLQTFLIATALFNLNGMVFIVTPVFVTNILSVFDSLLIVGAALFLWRIVGNVTRAQQGLTNIAEAFA